jgi:hypothetical protein
METHAFLLMMHEDFLERDERIVLFGSRFVNLTEQFGKLM